MQEPGSRGEYSKQQHLMVEEPQVNRRQQIFGMSSQMSFNGLSKKQKSKSFNRKQGSSQEQNSSILRIYRDLQYAPQIRNVFKRFCSLSKQKSYRLSFNELRDACQRQLKRIQQIKKSSMQVQRFLNEEDLDQTDNELSVITISCQIKSLVDAKNQFTANGATSHLMTSARQYENMLLEVQKSDQVIRNFINTNLKLPQPNDLDIAQCKRFFKKQAQYMSKSSDRVISSRKTLCEIVIFLCRLLEGQILAFQDVYEYQHQIVINQYEQTQNGRIDVKNRSIKNKEVKVRNLDQSFSDNTSSKDQSLFKNKDWNDYSSRDLGLKVSQLAGICEQIPQLESFTRTLKFSKITLDSRQSFFKIVDVIISLHHKIGYLSRNKPTLMMQMQDIQSELTQIYESIRQFMTNIVSQVPSFNELSFNKDKTQDSKHQMAQTLTSLRKDLKKLADIIYDQNKTRQSLYEKIDLIRNIVQSFYQSLNDGEVGHWEELTKKLATEDLDDDLSIVIQWLNDCFGIFQSEIRNPHRHKSGFQTQKSLQAQVHILLADYQKLRLQHQQLQERLPAMMQQKDDLLADIQQRDKMISNLTNLKITAQKRQRSLRDQLLIAQSDRQKFLQDIQGLEHQIDILQVENQNHQNDLIYEHQDEIKELVDKIAQLERARLDILQKYQQECMKTIGNLQSNNTTNSEIQALKQRLEKKTKQLDDQNGKFKHKINLLEKELQQYKNQKQILQNKLQFSQKNKNRLMQKLDQVNNKYAINAKDHQQKHQDQLQSTRQSLIKAKKQLQKQKRSNQSLTEQLQHLKSQFNNQSKTCNQYRQKSLQFKTLQNQYDSLAREYDRLLSNYNKVQNNSENLKQKLFEASQKYDEYIEQINKGKEAVKRLQKKNKDLEGKLQDATRSHEGIDAQLKQQQRANKSLQNKVTDLQGQIQALQDSLYSKQKNHNNLYNKSQLKLQNLEEQRQNQMQRLEQKLKQLQNQKEDYQQKVAAIKRELRQLSAELRVRDERYESQRKELERKLAEAEVRSQQLQKQRNSMSLMLKELKLDRADFQAKLGELETAERQKNDLKRSVYNMQQAQNKLQVKIQRLQDQVSRLSQQIQKLKAQASQKQREFDQRQRQFQVHLSQQQKQWQNQAKPQQTIQFRQQITSEKTTIIQQNSRLHQQNNQLHDQVEKLRNLNATLERNIKKLQFGSNQSAGKLQEVAKQFRESVNKYVATVNALEEQMAALKAENQSMKRANEQLKGKFQEKCRLVIQKDGLIFQKQLEKKNSDKYNKQLKYTIQDLQNTIQNLNQAMQKLKNNRIKALQGEVQNLNSQLNQYRKKEELNRQSISQLQTQIQRVKKDNSKKLQILNSQKAQSQEYYQSRIKKLQSQHCIELGNAQKRGRKQAQNQFNQVLLRQKEAFNNLSISKMQELGQLQRKYDKLIKDQRSQRKSLQQQHDDLLREFSELKRRHQSATRQQVSQPEHGNLSQQLEKLRVEYESLKRQNSRQFQDAQRLQKELIDSKQQNSSLITRNMELDHTIVLLNAKINHLNLNIQSTKKSLDNEIQLEREKSALQRDLQKYKHKSSNDEAKSNDYKLRIQELQKRISQLQAKISSYRTKQFQWSNNNSEWSQKSRSYTLQINQLNQRVNDLERELLAKEQKLKQRQNEWNNSEQQLAKNLRNWQDKQRQNNQTQSNHSRLQMKYQNEAQEWTQKQSNLKQQIERLLRRLKQLQYQVQNCIKVGRQSSRLAVDFTNLTRNYQIIQQKSNKLESDLNQTRKSRQNIEREKTYLQKQVQNLTRQKQSIKLAKNRAEQQNNRLLQKNNQLTQQIARLKIQLHSMLMQNKNYEVQLHTLTNITKKSSQVENQMRKLKQFYEKQMKALEQRLIENFDKEKKVILADCEDILGSMRADLKKQQLRANQQSDRYNHLLSQMQQNNLFLQKIRKQNMQLSQHCKKYQQRINTLQAEHRVKGNVNVQTQTKYKETQTKYKETQFKYKEAQTKYKEAQNKYKEAQFKYKEAQRQKGKLQQENRLLQRQLNELRNRNRQFSQMQSKYQMIIDERNRLEQGVKLLQQQLQKTRNQNKANFQIQSKLQAASNQIYKLQQNYKILEGLLQNTRNENSFLQQRISQVQGQRSRVQHEKRDIESKANQSFRQIQNLRRKLFQLEAYIKNLQSQQKLSQAEKQSHSNLELQRLSVQLALTRQQLLRLHEVIKKKDQDFQKQIVRLTQEKGGMFRDNQNIFLQCQSLKIRLRQLQTTIQDKYKQSDNLKNQNDSLMKQAINYRKQDTNKDKQTLRLNQIIVQMQRKQYQMNINLGRIQSENRTIQFQIGTYRGKLDHVSQKGQEFKLMEGRLKEQNGQLQVEIARLRSQISIVKMQYQRLHGQNKKVIAQIQSLNQQNYIVNQRNSTFDQQKSTLNQQNQTLNQQNQTLNQQNQTLNRQNLTLNQQNQTLNQQNTTLNQQNSTLNSQLIQQKAQTQRSYCESFGKEITITILKSQIDRLNVKIKSMFSSGNSSSNQLERAHNQIYNLTNILNGLQRENQQFRNHLNGFQQQNHQLRNIISVGQAQNQDLKNIISVGQAQNHQLKNIIDVSQTKNHQLRIIIDADQRQIQDFKNIIDAGQRQIHDMSIKLGQAQRENQQLRNKLNSFARGDQQLQAELIRKQQILAEMNYQIAKGKQVMSSADKQLKTSYEERKKLSESLRLTTLQKQRCSQILRQTISEKQNLTIIINTRQTQIHSLNQTITILQRSNAQLHEKFKQRYQELSSVDRNGASQSGLSKSSVNLVTKSYSYQGGQLTAAEFHRLQEEVKRLIKQMENKNSLILKIKADMHLLTEQNRVLKEQILLLSQGKTINIKSYTRITNQKDNSLNTKGVVYTQYDIKQFKARIQLLQKSVARYQNHQTQLLRQIQKYKFRQRAYLEQIKNQQHNNSSRGNNLIKKTSFDDGHASANYPQSSTYRLQSGVQDTQNSIHMSSKDKYFLRIEGQDLRKTIQRITNSNHITSSKIDQILENSRNISRQGLEHVLGNNQYNIPVNMITQIKDLIYQNKALIETLRSLKKDREDVNLLIQQYIDPQLLTEFVYRILTYFSEVQDQSEQANCIRDQLNSIRRNNVGGYYFTVLQEYTKFILQHNSIQIYKQQLREKAKQLMAFRQKFQSLIDSKLDQKDKLLKKSDSKGSLTSKTCLKFMANSRVKYQHSQVGSKDFSKNRQQFIQADYRVKTGNEGIIPHSYNIPTNISISPSLVTVNIPTQRSRTTSHISYTPYNRQVFSSSRQQTTLQRRSVNQSHTSAIYSTTNITGNNNQNRTVNSPINEGNHLNNRGVNLGGYERKLI